MQTVLPVNAPADTFEPVCSVFRRRLRAEGLKYTPERARVLDAVIQMDRVFEADQLIDALRAGTPRVSKATVYRTIRLMLDAGIIQRVLFDEDQSHYQPVFGRRPQDLIVRLDTRDATPIDDPGVVELRDRICRDRGLVAQGHRLLIYAVAAPARG